MGPDIMNNCFLQYTSDPRIIKIHVRYCYKSIARILCPLLCELIDLIYTANVSSLALLSAKALTARPLSVSRMA